MTNKPPLHNQTLVKTGSRPNGLVPTTTDDFIRIAGMLYRGGLIPVAFKTPEAVLTVMMMGADLGFTPTQALANISIINGKLAVYGDGLTALARRGGNRMEEVYEGSLQDDNLEAVCRITRADTGEVIERRFSVFDAQRAGLWQTEDVVKRFNRSTRESYEVKNDSPWYKYPKRMLMWRARSWAVRDGLSDQMFGVAVVDEQLEAVQAEETDNLAKVEPSRLMNKIEAMKGGAETQPEQEELEAEDATVIEDDFAADQDLEDMKPAGDPSNGFDAALDDLAVELGADQGSHENFYFDGFTFFFFRSSIQPGVTDVTTLRDDGRRVTFGAAMLAKFAPAPQDDLKPADVDPDSLNQASVDPEALAAEDREAELDTSERPVLAPEEDGVPMNDDMIDWIDFMKDPVATLANLTAQWAKDQEDPWFDDLSEEQRAWITSETEAKIQELKDEEA